MIRILLMLSILSGDPDIPVIETEEVLVTATHLKGKGSSFVTVIKGEEVQGESLASVISKVEGTDALSYGGTGSLSYSSIRGSTGNQVLVLIDGIRLNNTEEGGFNLSLIPLGAVERIEVMRGGGSYIYGADALGGVINIVTKNPGLGPSTTVGASYGSFNTMSLSLSQEGKVRSLDYLASVTTKRSEGNYPFTNAQGGLSTRENNSFLSLGFLGKGGLRLAERMRMSFSGDIYGNDADVPGSIFYPTPQGKQSDRRGFLDASLIKEWPGTGETGFRGYFLSQTREYFDNIYVMENQKSIFRNYGTGAVINSQWSFESHSPSGSIELRNDVAHSTTIGTRERTTASVFLQDLVKIWKDLARLPFALRLDWTNDFGSALSPKIGFLVTPMRVLSLKGNVCTSYRAPTFDDLYWPEDAFSIGNPSLRPERAINYDIGAEGGMGGIRAEAAYFRNDVRDLIQWAPGAGGKWSPMNISRATLQGTETGVGFTIPHASFSVNYTFLSAKDENGRNIFYRPAHRVNGRAELRAGMVSFFMEPQFVSSRYIDLIERNMLPAYVTIGLGSAVVWKEFEFRARTKQVFDTALHPFISYQEVYGYPIPGWSWELGVTWKQ